MYLLFLIQRSLDFLPHKKWIYTLYWIIKKRLEKTILTFIIFAFLLYHLLIYFNCYQSWGYWRAYGGKPSKRYMVFRFLKLTIYQLYLIFVCRSLFLRIPIQNVSPSALLWQTNEGSSRMNTNEFSPPRHTDGRRKQELPSARKHCMLFVVLGLG